MSEEQLKAFLEKVKADTSLQEKLNGASDAVAVAEIAKEAGFSITAEDIQLRQSETEQLSDEELEGAAGGGSNHCPVCAATRAQPMDPLLPWAAAAQPIRLDSLG